MEERDDELARALGDLHVPDHGATFWSDLDRRLASSDDGAALPGGRPISPDQPPAHSVGADAAHPRSADPDPTSGPIDGRPTAGPPDGGSAAADRRSTPGAADRRLVAAGTGGRSTSGPTDERSAGGPAVGRRASSHRAVTSPGRRRRGAASASGRRSRPLLAAAAALAVSVGGAAILTRDGDRTDQVVTVAQDPTTPGPAATGTTGPNGDAVPGGEGASVVPPTPDRQGDPTAVTTREPVGSGVVVAALARADGSAAVLTAGPLPGDETGCEGAPLEGLSVVQPGGDTRVVTTADGSPVTGGVDVQASPRGDRVAVTTQCEGFLEQLLVGRVGPDGVPLQLELVAGMTTEGDPAPDGPPADGVGSVSWSADGQRVLVTPIRTGDDGSVERSLWSYDASSGTWSERTDAPAGIVAAVERSDGTLVAITEDALVVGDEAQPRRGVNRLVLSPDGRTVAALGENGLVLIDETGGVAQLAGGTVIGARFLSDGSPWLVMGRFDDQSGLVEVSSLPSTGGQVEPSVLGTSRWGWFEVLPDASGLVVTVDGPADTEGSGPPVVERWSFAAR